MGEMAAGLAHELNQPLASLRLYAATAGDIAAECDSPRLAQCLTRIDEQSLRAGEIIRRMRSFVTHRPMGREPTDINQLVREVLPILENELRHARITLELSLAEPLPAVLADGVQIQQILINLVRNAIDAMTGLEDGSRRLFIGTKFRSGQVRIVVGDTGAGLAPKIAANLFQPFQSTKPTGLGLGLAICRTLIQAHGGQIGVEATTPRGTTFLLFTARFDVASSGEVA